MKLLALIAVVFINGQVLPLHSFNYAGPYNWQVNGVSKGKMLEWSYYYDEQQERYELHCKIDHIFDDNFEGSP